MTTKSPMKDAKANEKYERNNLLHILNIKMKADKAEKAKSEKKILRKRKKIHKKSIFR